MRAGPVCHEQTSCLTRATPFDQMLKKNKYVTYGPDESLKMYPSPNTHFRHTELTDDPYELYGWNKKAEEAEKAKAEAEKAKVEAEGSEEKKGPE